MSLEQIKALMKDKPYHWTDEAACDGDARFTGRFTSLTVGDHAEMHELCRSCPVYWECSEWADRDAAVDVFAAGYWRFEP